MQSELIMEYFSNPVNNFEPSEYTFMQHEGNKVCGDDINIFVTLDKSQKTIKSLHYTGQTSMVTSAAASFTADLVSGQDIDKVIQRDYKTLKSEGFEVTTRRERAAVITLIALQNGLYKLQKNSKRVTFEDLLENY